MFYQKPLLRGGTGDDDRLDGSCRIGGLHTTNLIGSPKRYERGCAIATENPPPTVENEIITGIRRPRKGRSERLLDLALAGPQQRAHGHAVAETFDAQLADPWGSRSRATIAGAKNMGV